MTFDRHTFRHSYSCLLGSNRCDVRVWGASRSDTSEVGTTLNIYAQAPSDERRIAQGRFWSSRCLRERSARKGLQLIEQRLQPGHKPPERTGHSYCWPISCALYEYKISVSGTRNLR